MTLKKQVQLLKCHMAQKLTEVTGIGSYLRRRSNYVHMGLDMGLCLIKN